MYTATHVVLAPTDGSAGGEPVCRIPSGTVIRFGERVALGSSKNTCNEQLQVVDVAPCSPAVVDGQTLIAYMPHVIATKTTDQRGLKTAGGLGDITIPLGVDFTADVCDVTVVPHLPAAGKLHSMPNPNAAVESSAGQSNIVGCGELGLTIEALQELNIAVGEDLWHPVVGMCFKVVEVLSCGEPEGNEVVASLNPVTFVNLCRATSDAAAGDLEGFVSPERLQALLPLLAEQRITGMRFERMTTGTPADQESQKIMESMLVVASSVELVPINVHHVTSIPPPDVVDSAVKRYLQMRSATEPHNNIYYPGDIIAIPLVGQQQSTGLAPDEFLAAVGEATTLHLASVVDVSAYNSVLSPSSVVFFRVDNIRGGLLIDPESTAVTVASRGVADTVPTYCTFLCSDWWRTSSKNSATTPAGVLSTATTTSAGMTVRNAVVSMLVEQAELHHKLRHLVYLQSKGLSSIAVVHGSEANYADLQLRMGLARCGPPVCCVSVLTLTDELVSQVLKLCSGAPSAVILTCMDRLPEQRLKELQLTLSAALKQDAPVVVFCLFSGKEAPPASFASLSSTEVIVMGPPGLETRQRCLEHYCTQRYLCSPLLDFDALAQASVGMTVADLLAWVDQALLQPLASQEATKRDSIENPLEGVGKGFTAGVDLVVSQSALEQYLTQYQKQHGQNVTSTKLQPVYWDDIGGLEEPKREIREAIELPVKYPHLFAGKLKPRSGLLMYGPPGCGKTLLAKAVATECGLNFISVKGPELINMYVGESERNIRELFTKARAASPCIVFFDELDALAPNRGAKSDSGGVMDRIVAQLLAEIDGASSNGQGATVFVIGATNRPDLLDNSLLRPGRFDRLCYLGVPRDPVDQLNTIKSLTRKFKLAPDVNFNAIVDDMPGTFTGADFYALCSDALMAAMEDVIEGRRDDVVVQQDHFVAARDSMQPSVSEEDLARYERMKTQFR